MDPSIPNQPIQRPPPPQVPQPPQPEPVTQQQSEASGNTKTIITVLLLLFVFPIGIIFMWLWMKWPIWAKAVLSIIMLVFIAFPLAIAFIAINPSRQFVQANNTKRASDVNAILYSVNQYMTDNNGQPPAGITTNPQDISTTGADICKVLVPAYLAALPVDPLVKNGKAITDCAVAYDTGYTIIQDAGNHKVTVSASKAEGNGKIEVTR